MVAASTLYGGTYTQFDVSFRRIGIDVKFVEPDDPENFRKAITPKTKLLYGETIANPRMNVLDIEKVAADRARSGRAADDRQHHGVALPVPADRVWRRYRGALRHQVSRRPRHVDRRHHRRQRQVPVDRQVSRNHRAEPRLSRHEVRRSVRAARLHHQGPRGRPARFRTVHQPVQFVPVPAGHRDAALPHGGAQPQRAGGGGVAGEESRR